MLMPALDATWQLLDAVREGAKEEDDIYQLLEELSQKVNAQTQIVREEWTGGSMESNGWGSALVFTRRIPTEIMKVLWYLFHGRDEIIG